MTLVFQDSVEGLEALVDGRWLTVPVIPGTVTVNVADLLSRWTNGIYRSPKHRVALPGTDVQQSRYSTVFFYNPNSQVTVRCMDSCCGADRPRQYPPSWPGNSSDAAVPPSTSEPNAGGTGLTPAPARRPRTGSNSLEDLQKLLPTGRQVALEEIQQHRRHRDIGLLIDSPAVGLVGQVGEP